MEAEATIRTATITTAGATTAIMGTMGSDFMVMPIDNNIEVILLFVVLALIPFIFKRKIWAGIIYLLAYGWYFGRGLFTNILSMINGETLAQDEIEKYYKGSGDKLQNEILFYIMLVLVHFPHIQIGFPTFVY